MDRQTQQGIVKHYLRSERVARIARKANSRAQRRFAAMLTTRSYQNSTAEPTVLYMQSERLIDRLAA